MALFANVAIHGQRVMTTPKQYCKNPNFSEWMTPGDWWAYSIIYAFPRIWIDDPLIRIRCCLSCDEVFGRSTTGKIRSVRTIEYPPLKESTDGK